MIKPNQLSLPLTFSVNNELTDGDTRFLNVTIDVMHTGLNYNQTIFNKEVVDECVDTIKNTAILGYIREYTGEKDFKGHEYIITRIDQNGVEKKYIGSAYGVIPESCNPRWINKMCDDGQEREFLQVDGLLWTKFSDAVDIFIRDIQKSESMELEPSSIEGYEDEDENFVFTKFKFNGCCALGEGIEPACQNAKIEVQFSMSHFMKSVQEELADKISTYTKLLNANEGGNSNMAKENKDFSMSILQQYENIANIVRQYETFADRWGDQVARYCLVDIQDNEVIVIDRKDNYNYYGFTFTQDNDDVNIDFTNGVRKKIVYENYEAGSQPVENDNVFDFGKEIKDIEDKAFSKIEEAEQKTSEVETNYTNVKADYDAMKADYDTVKADYDAIKPEYDKFVEAEHARQEAEIDAKKNAEFARFEKVLADNEEFTALKEKKDELSVEEIATQCAVLFTKVNLGKNVDFSKNGSQKSVGIMDDTFDDNENFVSTKYGNIPV